MCWGSKQQFNISCPLRVTALEFEVYFLFSWMRFICSRLWWVSSQVTGEYGCEHEMPCSDIWESSHKSCKVFRPCRLVGYFIAQYDVCTAIQRSVACWVGVQELHIEGQVLHIRLMGLGWESWDSIMYQWEAYQKCPYDNRFVGGSSEHKLLQ